MTAAAAEGGEAVCWLDRVCPDCGALTSPDAEACWRCGIPTPNRQEHANERD